MKRIAFALNPTNWLGGRNYYANLFAAIEKLSNPAWQPIIFTGSKSGKQIRADFPGVEVIETAQLDRGSPAWAMNRSIGFICSRNYAFQRLVQNSGASVLSHPFSHRMVTGHGVPSLGWIPDFQHIHFPHLFTDKEREARDKSFLSLSEKCARIIVSSEAAKADFVRFAPEYGGRTAVLRFVAAPFDRKIVPALSVLQQKYGVQKPYFLLPNQFWAHKNHRVAVSALQILKRKNRKVLLIATGLTQDYRNPDFFPELMEFAKECDVLDVFRVLGPVPFEDLVGLMVHCVSFVNPSRFEGWSTSVEEAKSLGKRMLLSSIPVHREQHPELGTYFDPDDPEGLAKALWKLQCDFDEAEDQANQLRALADFPARQMKFALSYRDIVLGVLK